MLGHREFVFDDYIEIMKRRRWALLLPILIIPAIALAAMMVVPKRYTSQTLVLVEGKQVPDDYVRPVLNQDITSRLASLREQVMSRSRLQPIIERFQMYPEYGTMTEKLFEMRKNIRVDAIRNDVGRISTGIPGFTIAFTASSPRVAHDVCGEITSIFLSENLKWREQAVEGTTQFIRGQLEEAKRNLDEQDAKLAAFERAHYGETPDQVQNNMGLLTTLNMQLDTNAQAISQLQQNRLYLQAMLTQAEQERPAAGAPGAPPVSALQQQLEKAQLALDDLKGRYTPDHPDVVAAEREVNSLKAKLADADRRAATPEKPTGQPKPVLRDTAQTAQMKAQLQSVVQAIEDKRHEQDRIRERLALVQSRVQSSPTVQEQQKALTRDYQTALAFYNELLTKQQNSEMAGDLEKKQQGEQFRVMDPPNLPDKPTFPDPRIFLGGGFALALMLSLGLTAWLEYRDHSLRNERDIFAFTQITTLGAIPLTIDALPPSGMRGLLPKRRKEYAGAAE